MLTRQNDYAIRAVLGIAEVETESASISTRDLAERIEAPYRFLRRIVTLLAESGVIESKRGNQGGLKLGRPAAEISLFDVIEAIDPAACILNACLRSDGDCPRSSNCRVHKHLGTIQQTLHTQLRNVTFQQLLEEQAAAV